MILDAAPKQAFAVFLRQCEQHRLPANAIKRIGAETIAHLRGSKKQRKASVPLQRLELRWYESLKAGVPDYSVYAEDAYLGELWACWAVYSRSYLRNIRAPGSMADRSVVSDLGKVERVVDLGCGFGWTTCALRELFPGAAVFGTNLDGAKQTKLARTLGDLHGFCVLPSVAGLGQVDLVFASEYFEHFQKPIAHLAHVLDSVSPRALLVCNAFTARSIGHFDRYEVDGERVEGKVASLAFSAHMRARGYEKVKTKLWNNRPAYWKLAR